MSVLKRNFTPADMLPLLQRARIDAAIAVQANQSEAGNLFQPRKESLTDPSHVRNAIARLDQVTGAYHADRDSALANIKKAATYYGVHLFEEVMARARRSSVAP
jgi:hypothetical protein